MNFAPTRVTGMPAASRNGSTKAKLAAARAARSLRIKSDPPRKRNANVPRTAMASSSTAPIPHCALNIPWAGPRTSRRRALPNRARRQVATEHRLTIARSDARVLKLPSARPRPSDRLGRRQPWNYGHFLRAEFTCSVSGSMKPHRRRNRTDNTGRHMRYLLISYRERRRS
jgi:hypothetical protein